MEIINLYFFITINTDMYCLVGDWKVLNTNIFLINLRVYTHFTPVSVSATVYYS